MRRGAALLAAAALTCGLPATSVSAAGGACPSLEDGVTVVVDFQSLGGGTVVRCAPGDPDTGLAALAAAGFRVDQVANQPGFVCRIDGLPGPETEDCADTPPARAYWGYSHAERGGSWSYSGSGAHVYDPPVGTVEGWAFNGDGGSTQPTIPPPPPPEPEPSPSPEPRPSPSPTTTRQADPAAEPSATGPVEDEEETEQQLPAETSASTPAPPASDAPATPEAERPARGEATTPDPPEDEPTGPGSDLAAAAADGGPGTSWGAVLGALLAGVLVLVGFLLRARNRRTP